MSGNILSECLSAFRVSAWRLESLAAYSDPDEDEQIRAWRDGQPRPERSVRTDAYLRRVASDVLAGRDRKRIRVLDEPPGEYARWELTGLAENAVAGEETWVTIRRSGTSVLVPALAESPLDFWLFDAGTEDERAVLMEYDTAGAYVTSHLATAVDHRWYWSLWKAAAVNSVPLADYLARNRQATAAA